MSGTPTTNLTKFIVAPKDAVPDESAILEVVSTTQGLKFPEMTTAQRDAITPLPANGNLFIYNLTTKQLEFYNDTTWGAV